MRLFVPTLGDVLILEKDWTFDLHDESRNHKFVDLVLKIDPAEDWEQYWQWREDHITDGKIQVTLPAGTSLKVDRIFIRKGAGDYDSMTFWVTDCPNKEWAPKKAGGTGGVRLRFWVKLADANRMEIENSGVQ